MMNYWKVSQDEDCNIYSVDMLRIVLELRKEEVDRVLRYFYHPMRFDVKEYPVSFKDFTYRNMFTVEYEKGATMTVGLVWNGTNAQDDMVKGFIEVNPNKCFIKPQCLYDVYYTLDKCVGYKISRWDLAIDIPIDRMSVVLGKDQRKYELTCKSKEDRTEYLGCRNEIGRVKVYNKTLESNLDYTLTRCELTMPNYEDQKFFAKIEAIKPEVWIAGTDTGVDLTGLSDSQAVLVELIRLQENPTLWLKRLEYRQRKKIEPFVFDGYKRLKFDNNCVESIIAELKDFFNPDHVFSNLCVIRRLIDETLWNNEE